MNLNDYRDLECEANGMTTPHEKAKRRSDIEKIHVSEQMNEFWNDYYANNNTGITGMNEYTINNLK